MAAALRALRRLAVSSPAVLAPRTDLSPSSTTPPSPPTSLRLADCIPLRLWRPRFSAISASATGGGLASVRRASLTPMRHQARHGCTKGTAAPAVPALRRLALFMPRRAYYSPKFNSLEQCECSDEEAVRFLVEKLQGIDKTLEDFKRILMFMALVVGMLLHRLYGEVAALGEKVARLERHIN